jgi:hypothetical protein
MKEIDGTEVSTGPTCVFGSLQGTLVMYAAMGINATEGDFVSTHPSQADARKFLGEYGSILANSQLVNGGKLDSYDMMRIEAGVPHCGPAFDGVNASESRCVLFFSARKRSSTGEQVAHDVEAQFTTSTALVELVKLIIEGAIDFNLSDVGEAKRVAFAGETNALACKVLTAAIVSAGTYHPDQFTSRLLGTGKGLFDVAVRKHFLAVELQSKSLLHTLGQGEAAAKVATKRKRKGEESLSSVSDMIDMLGQVDVT